MKRNRTGEPSTARGPGWYRKSFWAMLGSFHFGQLLAAAGGSLLHPHFWLPATWTGIYMMHLGVNEPFGSCT